MPLGMLTGTWCRKKEGRALRREGMGTICPVGVWALAYLSESLRLQAVGAIGYPIAREGI